MKIIILFIIISFNSAKVLGFSPSLLNILESLLLDKEDKQDFITTKLDINLSIHTYNLQKQHINFIKRNKKVVTWHLTTSNVAGYHE